MAETVSYENEAALIGSVFRDSSDFEGLSDIVQPIDFDWHPYAWAWMACQSLHKRGMSIDEVTVGDEIMREGKLDEFQVAGGMFKGRAALSKLREEGNPQSAWTYAEKVLDYSAKRQIELKCAQWTDWSRNGRTAPQIMADMVKQLGEIKVFNSQAFEHTQTLSEAVSEAYDHTYRAANGEIQLTPTGYKDLDKLFAGGMSSPDLYLVAGRPGTGKTAFLVSIAKNVAYLGKKVAIFSLEMENKQIAMRLIAQEAGVSYDKQKSGQLTEDEWNRYTQAIETLGNYPIVINDLPSISISKIRQELRRMGKVDLIIIDYIQLGGVDGKHDRRDQEIGELTRGLKSIAKEFSIPVLAAAQLSRALEGRKDKRPILSDLRESGDLEQDSDVVMFIYRPDQFEKGSERQNSTEIIVAKHRNGAVGSVDLIYIPFKTRFESATARTVRL